MPYLFQAGITQAQAKAACETALTEYGYTSTVSALLNTSISSRASETGIKGHVKSGLTDQGLTTSVTGKINTTVSSRAAETGIKGHVLSGLTQQGLSTAVTGRIDTAISSRASSTGIVANVQSGLTAQGLTTARAGYLDNIVKDIEDAVGSKLMTTVAGIIKEFTTLTQRMDCYIDLTTMASGDTIVIQQSMKIKSGGGYVLFAQETFTGVQTQPLYFTELKPAKYGFKIMGTQSAGVPRTLDWQTFKQVKSG